LLNFIRDKTEKVLRTFWRYGEYLRLPEELTVASTEHCNENGRQCKLKTPSMILLFRRGWTS
jgi:hypothetical protein